MNATRDPESMTADERRLEVASILAAGLLRQIRHLKANGVYRTALDDCEGCEGGRYYPQGRQMVCTVCGKRFSYDELATSDDNPCVPTPVPHTVDREHVVWHVADIATAAGRL